MNDNAYLNDGEFKPVRLADIVVPAYQREGTERSANNVATNFDPQLLQAITLVEITEDELEEDDEFLVKDDAYHRTGKLYLLVDGLQRCTGLAITHESDAEVMAQVFTDVKRDRQVDLFVGLNRGSVRVKDYWIYRAKKNSAHPGILAIDKTLTNAGFRAALPGGTKLSASVKNNSITSIGLLARFCGVDLTSADREEPEDQEDALEALGNALSVLNNLWPASAESSIQRTNAGVLFGLATLFRDATTKRGGKRLEVKRVLERMTEASATGLITPGHLLADANVLKSKGSATSGGGNSTMKYVTAAWLGYINKGHGSNYSLGD
jgi:hypothetical protein